MKNLIIAACTVTFFCCSYTTVMAVPKPEVLDRDCTAAKAGKNLAMKATVGVGGPCGPADAAKDTAKGAVDLDDKMDKEIGKKNKKHKKKDKGLLRH